MKAATIHEIKQELASLQSMALVNLCLRLGKFKKENKELLTYLLFEAHDEGAFIGNAKQEMDEQFTEVNTSHAYLAKKTLRKILRIANKHIRFSGSKQVETELLLHFCTSLKETGLVKQRNAIIHKLFQQQLGKAKKAMESLHEDLQYEYREIIINLS